LPFARAPNRNKALLKRRSLILAAAASSVLAAVSGCSKHEALPPRESHAEAAKAARAYAKIALQTRLLYVDAAQHAETKLNRSFDECPVVQRRDATSYLPPESRFDVLQRAAIAKIFFPAYRAFVRRLSAIHTSDAYLRQAQPAVRILSTYYRPLRASDPDYCLTLRRWERLNWKPNFDVASAIGARVLTKDAPASVRDARVKIGQTSARMVELGVGPTAAKMFRELANFPGTSAE
jgi:hypothetical protein